MRKIICLFALYHRLCLVFARTNACIAGSFGNYFVNSCVQKCILIQFVPIYTLQFSSIQFKAVKEVFMKIDNITVSFCLLVNSRARHIHLIRKYLFWIKIVFIILNFIGHITNILRNVELVFNKCCQQCPFIENYYKSFQISRPLYSLYHPQNRS